MDYLVLRAAFMLRLPPFQHIYMRMGKEALGVIFYLVSKGNIALTQATRYRRRARATAWAFIG